MRLPHLTATLALALAGTGACASLGASRQPEPYRVAVRNATGTDVTVEYCGPVGDCPRLGELATGATRTFAIPASAAQSRYGNRVLILGKVYSGNGFRQVAQTPVLLVERHTEVALTPRARSSTSR